MSSSKQEEGKGHVVYVDNNACPGCMTGYWVRQKLSTSSEKPSVGDPKADAIGLPGHHSYDPLVECMTSRFLIYRNNIRRHI